MASNTDKLNFLEILRADMRAMILPRTGILSMIYYSFRMPCFLAVLLYRLSSACINKGQLGRAAAFFFWRLNILINGCEIDPRAKIGEGFSLPHPLGVVIGGPVVIGRNVEILQNVTMGRRVRYSQSVESNDWAQVEDDVSIYVGAVLIGGVKIGKGASIGANAVVLQDVPENCTAVGVPAHIVEKY